MEATNHPYGDIAKALGTRLAVAAAMSIAMAIPMTTSGQEEGEQEDQERETSRGGYDLGRFAKRARDLGLTPAEAAALQKQVDEVVVQTGGTQIAINQILSRDGSSTITIPLPSERADQGAPESDESDGVMITLNPTADDMASDVTAAAPAPSTWPRPEKKVFLRPGEGTPCWRGRSCAVVRYGGGAYVFKFVDYGTYGLSYWYGSGYVLNSQTDGAATRLDDVNGRQVRCLAPHPAQREVNWTPIWRIRLTASRC